MNIEPVQRDDRTVNTCKEAVANLDPKMQAEFGEAFAKTHMENFFDCVDSRSEPISDVASHVNTMNSCHLSNIAVMLGRDLKWDPKSRNFGSDDQANALLSRKRRDGFQLVTEKAEAVGAG